MDEFECPACGHVFRAPPDEEVLCPACDCIVVNGEDETPSAPAQPLADRDARDVE